MAYWYFLEVKMAILIVDVNIHRNRPDADLDKSKRMFKTFFRKARINRKRLIKEVDHDDYTFSWYFKCQDFAHEQQIYYLLTYLKQLIKETTSHKLGTRRIKRKGYGDDLERLKEMTEQDEDFHIQKPIRGDDETKLLEELKNV